MNHEMTPENTKHLSDLTENAIRVFVDALDRYEHRAALEAALQSGRIVETIVSLHTNLATSDPTIVVELLDAGGERHEIYRHVGRVARTSH